MDEILEVVDVIADFGLEGVITWILRLIGLVVLLVGLEKLSDWDIIQYEEQYYVSR